MGNIFFIKIEIYTLIFTFLYILYYSSSKIISIFLKIKKILNPEKIENIKSALNKVVLNSDSREETQKIEKVKLSNENKEKVLDIIKRVKSNSLKWYYDLSQSLIVEWLSIDKYNKELNLELASIYEKEKRYLNAEYIYKDLLEVMKNDFEVMKKLWFVYALQNKLTESLEIYELVHKKKKTDDEVIDILAELSFSIEDYKKALKYANMHLVSKPRDVEKLFIKAKSFEELRKTQDSILTYKRILELQPYNTKAKECIEQLEGNM